MEESLHEVVIGSNKSSYTYQNIII